MSCIVQVQVITKSYLTVLASASTHSNHMHSWRYAVPGTDNTRAQVPAGRDE